MEITPGVRGKSAFSPGLRAREKLSTFSAEAARMLRDVHAMMMRRFPEAVNFDRNATVSDAAAAGKDAGLQCGTAWAQE